MSVMSDVIKLCLYPCKSTRKTGFHYFIFHRKPLHWDGHGLGLGLGLGTVALALALVLIVFGLGLGLECSGLVNITDYYLKIQNIFVSPDSTPAGAQLPGHSTTPL